MQTQVEFFVLPDTEAESNNYLLQACVHAANLYRQNIRAYIYTEDLEQAHHIDELLWSFDPQAFVPHNLVGEGPKQGAAIEIGHQPPQNRRPVLINLTTQVPNFVNQYQQIIDFVPAENQLKQHARERFKQYRAMGFAINTHQAKKEQAITEN
ncbi:DNA polymerase III subunit chi [Thalassotalea sp. LPB0316]|uniref:DNA polymerase III subunit chi n=1 Tax=Thalassotalea sp. LPB0316 TaxID=2769490 RepID=UPI0018683038|nr:DNA polymerase III subunit chi [Thalassotalea sp. LPB0316]QOL25861.1 DNA polymerase III subunit chi [Thalassotalea sp. LPB0316]